MTVCAYLQGEEMKSEVSNCERLESRRLMALMVYPPVGSGIDVSYDDRITYEKDQYNYYIVKQYNRGTGVLLSTFKQAQGSYTGIQIDAGTGQDEIYPVGQYLPHALLIGNAGHDSLTGSDSGLDTLDGSGGNDRLY